MCFLSQLRNIHSLHPYLKSCLHVSDHDVLHPVYIDRVTFLLGHVINWLYLGKGWAGTKMALEHAMNNPLRSLLQVTNHLVLARDNFTHIP